MTDTTALGRTLTVAKKDYRDAVQSRALWALVVIFVILTLISSYAYAEVPELFGGPDESSFEGLVFFTAAMAALFVPIAAIIVCYKSLAGERESGSMKVLLSLPATRRDIFFGKLIGRSAVISTGLALGIIIGLAFGTVLLGEFDPVAAVVFFIASVVFAIIYSGIIVSLSAVTGSTVRATTYALGFFVIFELLWDIIPLGVLYVVEGFSLPQTFPDWFVTVTIVSPATAYFSAISALLPEPSDIAADPDTPGTGVEFGVEFGDSFFAQPEIGIAVLAFWLLVPLAVGYRRFNGADI